MQNCLDSLTLLVQNIEHYIEQLDNENIFNPQLNKVQQVQQVPQVQNISDNLDVIMVSLKIIGTTKKLAILLDKLQDTIKIVYAYTTSKFRLEKFYKKLEDQEIIDAMLDNKSQCLPGIVRVAKLHGTRIKDSLPYIKIPGFINVDVTHRNVSSIGSQLTPHRLQFKTGEIMENLLQFSKFYDIVPEIHSDDWEWKLEQHCDANNKPLKEYWIWRRAGFLNRVPVIPVKNKKPICYIWKDINGDYKSYNTVESRKNIYVPLYIKLSKLESDFLILQQFVKAGYNIQILDYSGPPTTNGAVSESEYNKITKMYEDLGEAMQGTLVMNEKNFRYIINSENIHFSHGYVLAAMLAQII